jgi:hypothetical protein
MWMIGVAQMLRRDVALAGVADTLTLARLGFALLLATVTARSLAWAGILLAAAWVSDALDGRAARASKRQTHLGKVDLTVDTAVGAGLLLGMSGAGIVPLAFAVTAVIVLGGGFLALQNPAPALALQGIAYGWFLVVLWTHEPVVRWVVLATIGVVFVAGARRLVTVIVPAFLCGAAALLRLRRGDDHGLLP